MGNALIHFKTPLANVYNNYLSMSYLQKFSFAGILFMTELTTMGHCGYTAHSVGEGGGGCLQLFPG